MKPRLTYANVTATAALILLWLTVTASALAWRGPTESERKAITRAAERTPHAAGTGRVYVGQIRVSTVGPWASAEGTIYVPEPDNATIILHKIHDQWKYGNVGTAGEQCIMPRADQQNLGFGKEAAVCTG
jgi:hypothetical protein